MLQLSSEIFFLFSLFNTMSSEDLWVELFLQEIVGGHRGNRSNPGPDVHAPLGYNGKRGVNMFL